jgi:hypothetical protein
MSLSLLFTVYRISAISRPRPYVVFPGESSVPKVPDDMAFISAFLDFTVSEKIFRIAVNLILSVFA